MKNIEYSEEQWAKIFAFLKQDPHVYSGQEPDCRRFLEAILWMARSGAQWRLLPEQYGRWNSIYKRFCRWQAQGVWQRMLEHFVKDPDMEHLLIDGTVIRAHPCAAGALKKMWRPGSAGAGTFSRRIQHQDSYRR